MKVSKAIQLLQENYQPDDQVVIVWWDKFLFTQDDGDTVQPVPVAAWNQAVSEFDQIDGFSERLSEQLYDFIASLVDKAIEAK